MTRNRIVAFALAALAVVGIGVSVSATSSTEAAWTDEVNVTATATSGTWNTVGENTCTAWDQQGLEIPCTVTSITYTAFVDGTSRARNYWIELSAANGYSTAFSVDLSTAVPETPADADADWDWTNAAVRDNAQFTPDAGWSCTDLPIVSGSTTNWLRNPWFQVHEDGSVLGDNTICG